LRRGDEVASGQGTAKACLPCSNGSGGHPPINKAWIIPNITIIIVIIIIIIIAITPFRFFLRLSPV
jgi:hypothetical protein